MDPPVLPGLSLLIATWLSTIIQVVRLRRGLRVRNNKLHSQREICSAGHELKLLWSLSLWNRNALFVAARVCSRILLLDSCVRRSASVRFAGWEPATRKSKYSTPGEKSQTAKNTQRTCVYYLSFAISSVDAAENPASDALNRVKLILQLNAINLYVPLSQFCARR